MTPDVPVTAACALTARSIRQRIGAANAFLRATPDWHPLPQAGSSNRLYRSRLRGQSWVLRLNASSDIAFGVDREKEAQILASIQDYSWAPQIRHNPWQEGWCLMADHGQSPSPQGDVDPTTDLLRAVNQWQQITRGPGIDYGQLLDQYRRVLNAQPDGLAGTLLARLSAGFEALPGVRDCLTHHDLHWGNLCQDSSSLTGEPNLVVLDWEYAAIGNPWFDAASLCHHFAATPAQIAALPAWHGMAQDRLISGLAAAEQMRLWLECLWYAVRCQTAAERAAWHDRTAALLSR